MQTNFDSGSHFGPLPARRAFLLGPRRAVRRRARGGSRHSLSRTGQRIAGRPRRHVVLLWMTGGRRSWTRLISNRDTPTAARFGRSTRRAPGLRISEHLPKLAAHGDQPVLRAVSARRREITAAGPS